MGRSVYFLAIYVAIGLYSYQAHARALSWSECVELASRESSDLRAAREDLNAAEAAASAARSGYLPQVNAAMGMVHGNSSTGSTASSNSTALGDPGQTYTNYTASVSGTLNLFNGLGDFAKSSQASASVRSAEANLAAARAQVSYELKSAYAGLLYSQEYLKLSAEIQRRRRDNLRMVELRYESGRENKGSVLLSRAYLAQAEYDGLQAKNAQDVARAQLARAIGADDVEALEVTGEDLFAGVVPSSGMPDFRMLATTAPERLAAVAREDSAEGARVAARSAFFPSLNATGSLGRQGSEFFPRTDRWSVGLSLSVPLFTGLKDLRGYQGAVSSLASAVASREGVERSILTQLKQAWANRSEAESKLRVDESFRSAALVRAEIARNKYNNGLLTFEDWDTIESDLIARQKAYLASRRDRAVADSAWEKAQGKGVVR